MVLGFGNSGLKAASVLRGHESRPDQIYWVLKQGSCTTWSNGFVNEVFSMRVTHAFRRGNFQSPRGSLGRKSKKERASEAHHHWNQLDKTTKGPAETRKGHSAHGSKVTRGHSAQVTKSNETDKRDHMKSNSQSANNRSIHQSINQPIDQSTDQSISSQIMTNKKAAQQTTK